MSHISESDAPRPTPSLLLDMSTFSLLLPPRTCRSSCCSCSSTCTCTSWNRLLRNQLSSTPSSNHPLGSIPSVRNDSTSGKDEAVQTASHVVDGGPGERRGVVSESNEVGKEDRGNKRGCEAGVRGILQGRSRMDDRRVPVRRVVTIHSTARSMAKWMIDAVNGG